MYRFILGLFHLQHHTTYEQWPMALLLCKKLPIGGRRPVLQDLEPSSTINVWCET
jgi:hypothetical protein